MKKLTKYVNVFIVQGNYGFGDGWEDLCSSEIRKESRENLKDYRINDKTGNFRLICRRVLREKFELGDF